MFTRLLVGVAVCVATVAGQGCPVPVGCPAGFTGRFCDIQLCDQKGTVRPPTFDLGYGIDIDMVNPCSGYFFIPVDSFTTALIIIVDARDHSGQPNAAIFDPKGNNITGQARITNDGKTFIATVSTNGVFGQYSAMISASQACTYQSHAQSNFTLSIGYTSGPRATHNDFPALSLTQNTMGYMVGHLNNQPFPGRAFNVEVWGNGHLVAGYDLQTRYACAYDLFAGPVICNDQSNWWFKVNGIDANGYRFMRTDVLSCVAGGMSTTTAMTPTTSASPCLNGGYYDPQTQSCICEFFWTGSMCQTPICANGGTPQNGQCMCAPNYGGFHCIDAMCSSMNQVPPFTPLQRTVAFVIQTTPTMAEDLRALQDLIAEIYYNFQQQHPKFVTNYIIATYDSSTAQVVSTSLDPLHVLEVMYHLNTSGDGSMCNKQFMQVMSMVLQKVNPYSYVFAFTDSPPDRSNVTLNLQVFDLLERTKNRVFISITTPPGGLCQPYSGGDFQYYKAIAQYTGADVFYARDKRNAFEIARVIPTAFMMSQVLVQPQPDCTFSTRTIYVPVDSHTASFTVSVAGNLPSVQIFQPDGTLWSQVPIVDDAQIAVRQSISPCPGNAYQRDEQCFYPTFNAASWADAQANCALMGGNLVNILHMGKQRLLDFEIHGVDFWTSLNDIKFEGAYEWASATGQPIPLGHWFTNWAAGQPGSDPNHQMNCMAVKYTVVNGTRVGRWYMQSCDIAMPYICQVHALDSNSNRLPAGIWRVEYTTQPGPNTYYNKSCLATVFAQTDLQVFYGFTTDSNSAFNDMPTYEPSSSSMTNRYVANITSLHPMARIDMVEFFDDGYNLIEAARMHFRLNCSYNLYSDVFKCPKSGFGMVLTGHDEKGYLFNRYDYAICIGGGEKHPFA